MAPSIRRGRAAQGYGCALNKAMGPPSGPDDGAGTLPPWPSPTGKQKGLRTVLTTPAQTPRCERQRTVTGYAGLAALESALSELHFRSSGVPPRGAEAADRDRLRRSGREAPDARVVTDRFTRGHRVCRCRSGAGVWRGQRSLEPLPRDAETDACDSCREAAAFTLARRSDCRRCASTASVLGTPVASSPPRGAEACFRTAASGLGSGRWCDRARRLAVTYHGRVQQSR